MSAETAERERGARQGDRADGSSRAVGGERDGTVGDYAELVMSIQRAAGNRAVNRLMARRGLRGAGGRSSPSTVQLQRETRGKQIRRQTRTVLRVTAYIDTNTIMLELDGDSTLWLPLG